jgi:hypothetical protein
MDHLMRSASTTGIICPPGQYGDDCSCFDPPPVPDSKCTGGVWRINGSIVVSSDIFIGRGVVFIVGNYTQSPNVWLFVDLDVPYAST